MRQRAGACESSAPRCKRIKGVREGFSLTPLFPLFLSYCSLFGPAFARQAAGGYVTYHEESDTFSLEPEQALVLAQEGHPLCMQGIFQQLVAQVTTHEQATDTFQSGDGRP